MGEGYFILQKKLDDFIRRFYLNQLIRGAIFFTGVFIVFFLMATTLEHLGRFNSTARVIILFSFLTVNLAIMFRLVIVPLAKMYQLGRLISKEDAALMIGRHFSEVGDKILNTLELYDLEKLTSSQKELILASIDQRTRELRPLPFSEVIDLKKNKRYLKYAVVPIGVFAIAFLSSPKMISESAVRIVDWDSTYAKPMPFQFIVDQTFYEAIRNDDVKLEVELLGQEVPRECFIELEGRSFNMIRNGAGRFQYTLKRVQEDKKFKFKAAGFSSEEIELKVLSKPLIESVSIKIDYPRYLGLESEEKVGVSELVIPEGSTLWWKIKTKDAQNLIMRSLDTSLSLKDQNTGVFNYVDVIKSSGRFQILAAGSEGISSDTLNSNITLIKDEKPRIRVSEVGDSTEILFKQFSCRIKDDYGFSRLSFVYQIEGKGEERKDINPSLRSNDQEVTHIWNIGDLDLEKGKEMIYYFEVWDNDGVNGPKYSRSEQRKFRKPSSSELSKRNDEKSEEVKSDLEANLEKAREIQEDLEALNKKLLENKNVGWEEKQTLKEILNKQESLRRDFEDTKKNNQLKNYEQQKMNQPSEDVRRKQEQLEELMERLMDEELKELMEEVQKLMEEMNKEQMQEKLDELELSNKDLEKELDRSLELFKQLEFENKLDEVIKDVQDIKKKQEELETKTSEDKSAKEEELAQEQEELQKQMEGLEEKLDDLEKKNQKLENKHELPDVEPNKDAAKKEMSKAAEEMKQGNKKQSKSSQTKAKQQLQKMENKLSGFQKQMQENQQAEDIESLRRMRQNLMTLSFDQEKLMDQLQVTQRNDPSFVELTREQKRLKDNSELIEDSLFAISKRNAEISNVVNKEISQINYNLDKAIEDMAERQSSQALNRQQFVMTSYNNLALMLDESIQKAQQQQSSKKFGEKSCSKPGSGMPNMSQMKQMQKQLSEQLKKLQQQMQEGQKGGKQQGNKGSRGSKMSEEVGKMAARQQAIRNELRRLSENGGKEGSQGSDGTKNIRELMEKNEEDILNKRITQETLRRQEEIMTRMLEYEKAERERELDKKRESQVGQNQKRENNQFLEYQRERERQSELLETIPLNLKPFYRNKVNEYYNNL